MACACAAMVSSFFWLARVAVYAMATGPPTKAVSTMAWASSLNSSSGGWPLAGARMYMIHQVIAKTPAARIACHGGTHHGMAGPGEALVIGGDASGAGFAGAVGIAPSSLA